MRNHSLHDTLERTAQILSRHKGITVVCRGNACPQTNGRRIVLPALPSPCPPHIERLFRGNLDHEIGHVLHSDFAVIEPFRAKHGERAFAVLNIIEDIRIEARMASAYPGARINLDASQDIIDERWREVMPSLSLWRRIGGQLFARGKGRTTLDFGADARDAVARVADLMKRAPALQNTAEASSLALAIFARWRAWAEANPASPLAGALADHAPEALTEPLIGLREELTEALAQLPATHSDAGYRIYTTERDEVLTAPAGATGSYAALLAKVKPHVSALRQKLLLTLRGQARTRLAPDPDGPILQTKRLHQLLLPVPQAPLASKVNAPAQNVAVSLLVDLSGSMRGPRIRLAQACAVLLSEVLDQLGYPCEVLGFTTATDHAGLEPVLAESGLKPTQIEASFTRYLPLRHVIYKSFGEHLRACRERFASMEVSHYTPLNESVVFAGRRLLAVPGSRHLLMVLTDGAPFLGTRAMADAALWNLKANLERLGRAGVETLAIGIQSDYVRQAFSQAIVIQELNGLPREFMAVLSKQLLAGARKGS